MLSISPHLWVLSGGQNENEFVETSGRRELSFFSGALAHPNLNSCPSGWEGAA